MALTVNISERKRRLKTGQAVLQTRYVLNYTDPRTGKRRQEFFERQKEAQARKSELILKVANGTFVDERTVPTIAEAIDQWLADKRSKVKANTLGGYEIVVAHIRGPFLVGT